MGRLAQKSAGTTREEYRCVILQSTVKKKIEGRLESLKRNNVAVSRRDFNVERQRLMKIFSVKQLLEKCWEYKVDVRKVYVDFKLAHGSID